MGFKLSDERTLELMSEKYYKEAMEEDKEGNDKSSSYFFTVSDLLSEASEMLGMGIHEWIDYKGRSRKKMKNPFRVG